MIQNFTKDVVRPQFGIISMDRGRVHCNYLRTSFDIILLLIREGHKDVRELSPSCIDQIYQFLRMKIGFLLSHFFNFLLGGEENGKRGQVK